MTADGVLAGRPDLGNRRLIALTLAAALFLVVYFLVLPLLPAALRSPGHPAVYLLGVAGSVLLLVAGAFVVAKRTGRGGSPVLWFNAHVVGGTAGFAMVMVHGTGRLDQAPALLLLNLAALMALGLWARLRAARTMADTFGTKQRGFGAPDPNTRAALARVIADKAALLARLDPAADEATFSVTLGHLLRRPVLATAYLRLARAEERLIGARGSVGPAQAWWRALHMALALTFVVGLVIHVVAVTFFAGYVADGGPVTWWHLTAWDL